MALERQRVFWRTGSFFQRRKVGPRKLTDQLATRIGGEHARRILDSESLKSSKRLYRYSKKYSNMKK